MDHEPGEDVDRERHAGPGGSVDTAWTTTLSAALAVRANNHVMTAS